MHELPMTMVFVLCWLKNNSHENTMNIMLKVYSHNNNSMVERQFSLIESMRYHDNMLVWVLANSSMTMSLSKALTWT